MLVPRRVRRRLLLPPGWVALGFLLLLGCQALLMRGHKLQAWNIVSLLMPPQNCPSSDMIELWGPAYFSTAKLEKYRPWHTIELNGIRDGNKLEISELTIRNLQADTAHSGGVRICLKSQVTYKEFIKVLDILYKLNHWQYWVDNRRESLVVYVITTHPTLEERRAYLAIACQGGGEGPPTVVPPTTAQIIASLRRPEWQQLLEITGGIIVLLITSCLGFLLVAFRSSRRSS